MGETINKTVKAKVVHKHETAAGWEQSNYIPNVGEIVFYDPDETHNYTRQKNGDGVNKVKDLPFSAPQADWKQTDETAPDYIKNKPGLSAGPGKHHLVAADEYLAGKASYTSQVINGSSMEYDYLYGHYVFKIPYPENYYYCSVDIFHENGDLWYQNASLNTISSEWDCSAWINGIYFTNPYPLEDLVKGNFYFTITNNSTPPNWLIEGANLTITRSGGGEYGLVIGNNIENGGNCNLLVGHDLQHEGEDAFVVGHYNKANNEALLQVGSGTEYYPKNALEVTATETRAPRIRVDNITPNNEDELTTKYYVDSAIENIPEQVQADWKQTDETAPDYIKNKPGLSAGPGKHHLVAADEYLAGKITYTSGVINGNQMEYDDYWLHYVLPVYPDTWYKCSVDIYQDSGILLYTNASLITQRYDWDCMTSIDGICFQDSSWEVIDLINENFYFTITDNSTPPNWLIEGVPLTTTRSGGGEYGLAIGNNIENGGECNLLVGQELIHKGNNALIVGQYNEQDPNALLQVGSGNSSYRKNALSVTDTKTVAPRMQVTNLTPNSSYELTTKHYVDNKVNTHANNTNVHVTAEEKQKWNNMANSGGGGSSNKLERTWLPAGYSGDCIAESVDYDIAFQSDNTRVHYYCNGMDEWGNWSTGEIYLTVNPQANVFVNIDDNYSVWWAGDNTLGISAYDPYYTLEIEVVTYEHWDVSQCTIFIYTTNANPGAATKL